MLDGLGWLGRTARMAVLVQFMACGAGSALAAPPSAGSKGSPPVIAGTPSLTGTVGVAYDFRPTASDPDRDPLSFSISNKPRWANFDSATGRLYGVPAGGLDIGLSKTVTISVSDGRNTASLPAFAVVVSADGSPVINGVPPTATREGDLYAFMPDARDPEGATLKFTVRNKPSWATFSRNNGLLSGIPPVGAAGSYSNIAIAVTDGQTTSALPSFGIMVTGAPNQPPTISGLPTTSIGAGQAYSFKPMASDPEEATLRFSILNLPGWATFDPATGQLSGVPSSSAAGTYANITISVSDGRLSTSLYPFTVTVTSPNTAPTISGSPSTTAKAGLAYSFAASANDPDGQVLKFSVTNQPTWASFDTATGALTGTPSDAQVGTSSNIVVSVTDGQATASLPAFAIVVSAATTGWASLSWVPPTQNVDGTPITDLAGYRVRYGTTSASLDKVLQIPSPTVTSAMLEALPAGTWYFAVKAYTAANVESDLSNVAQKTIQ
jgi:Putative Ig domain